MADNPRSNEITHKDKASIFRKPVSSLWIFIAALVLIMILAEIDPISKFFDRQIQEYLENRFEAQLKEGALRANQLAAQLQNNPLPEKTDVLEEIQYGRDRELSVILFIDSDLSQESIRNYYQNLGLLPVVNGDYLAISAGATENDGLRQLAEETAQDHYGSVQTFNTGSDYQYSYLVLIRESATVFTPSTTPQS